MAKRLLNDLGSFHPFAAVINLRGETVYIALDSGEEFPDDNQFLADLIITLEQLFLEDPYYAVCFALTTVRPEKGRKFDAIRFWLEHSCGIDQTLILPYRKKLFGGYVFEAYTEVTDQGGPGILFKT